MIIAILGTKGQYIKTAPIFLELEKRGYDYLFINAKQHVQSLDKMIEIFGTKKPDYEMWNFGNDITNVKEIIGWLGINFFKYIISNKRKIFKNKKKNLILVHGDAPPVLLGLFVGKFLNIKVVHIEAGCRSHNIFAPFPEEIIRILADRFSNILISLSKFASRNLQKGYSKKEIYYLERNTVYDAVCLALERETEIIEKPYVLVTIHRFETIQSKTRLKKLKELLIEISKTEKIIFPIHESTMDALEKKNLYQEITNNPNIKTLKLLSYFTFINYIKNAKYLITDGGGPQEESYYLGVPCLVLRDTSERIWENTCLTGFDENKIASFLKNPEKYRTKIKLDDYKPSKMIVDIFEKKGFLD